MNRILAASLLAMTAVVPAHAAAETRANAAPTAFTATYAVMRNGSPIGTSTLVLEKRPDGHWRYRSSLKATHGLASLLGADLKEVSVFRWQGGRPEAISYDYDLDAGIKRKQRRLRVDWQAHRVSVEVDGKHHYTYASVPGMVERHSVPLALLSALEDGHHGDIKLPVAVRNRVSEQSYRIAGRESVKVPAGTYDAERITRTDYDNGFTVWYAPAHFQAPVKLSQRSGGQLTMLLKSYRQP
jgi:hypothetical protein